MSAEVGHSDSGGNREAGATHPDGDVERRARWCVVATIVAVLSVHVWNVDRGFVFDDYYWLDRAPASPGDVLRILKPPGGTAIWRPLLDLWFDTMSGVFGDHPLPFHVFAIGAAVGAALVVRWMCLELGITMLPATVAGIVVGTHAALSICTRWLSATQSLMMIIFAAAAIAVVQREGARRQAVAAALLVVAIMWRDSAIVVPAMATVLIVGRPGVHIGLVRALRSTAALWVISLALGVYRLSTGALGGSSRDPYHSEIGPHMARNLWRIISFAARFGMPRTSSAFEAVTMNALVLVVLVVVVGGAVWAATRRSYLPAAGLLCFVIGTVPFLGLTRHPMEIYYIEVGIIGLAVTVGSLLDDLRPRTAVLVAGTAVFVLAQVLAAQVVTDRHWIGTSERRSAVLLEYARNAEITDDRLVVPEACAGDASVTKDGALFRVELGRPHLRVKFEVLPPGQTATTPWGCPTS